MKRWALLLALALALCTAVTAMAWQPCPGEHVYESWKTLREPTCTREGYQRKNCRNCNHYEWRNIPKLDHTAGEWTIENEPTCTKRGSKTSTCTVCGANIRAFIDALGHDYVIDEMLSEPTCTEKGKANATCSRCGKTSTITLDKLPHEYGEWTVLREPKGEHMGRRESTCAVCGKVVRENFFPDGTLYEGMENCPEVTALQEKLVALGYYSGGTSAGKFGPSTAYGVRRFQQDYDLEMSGVAYPETLEKIDEVYSQQP